MLSLQFVPRGFAAREPFHPFNGRSEFALRDPSLRSGSRRLPRRLAPARRKTGAASYRTAGRLIGRCCASNLQNRRTVSHILAGTKQHAPGSRSNILPGSAPALHSVILYPFFPLPLPLHTTPSPSPRPLARNPGAHPGASTFASYSGTNTAVSHTFCGETDGARWSRIPASETRSRGP